MVARKLKVVLKEDTELLDEVVVIGYMHKRNRMFPVR